MAMTREEIQELELYITLNDRGVISKKTLLEKVGINAEEEETQRKKEKEEERAQFQAQLESQTSQRDKVVSEE